MSSSKSSPTNTTATTNNVKTTNLNASGNAGPTVVGGGSISSVTNVTQTDLGSVKAAIQGSTGVATAALNTAESLNEASTNFADHTISTYTGAVSELADKFGAEITTLAGQQQTQLGNTTEALATIAHQQSESGAQQVIDAVTQSQESFQNIIKYVAIAVVAAGVIYLAVRKG